MIGCRRIAQAAHLQAIVKSAAVELVCDPSPALSRGVAGQYGVSGFTDSHELLKQDLETVVIATPDRFHFPLGLDALNAGMHVLMEKPLAATSTDAAALAELAVRKNLRLQVGAMKRHDPGIAFAHDHLAQIGEIVSFSSVYRIPAQREAIEDTVFPVRMVVDDAVRSHENTFKAQANRASYLLATHGAHVFDQVLFFTGSPRWTSMNSAVVGADHTWHGVVGLAGGGLGAIEITVDVHADASEGFQLYGTKGSMTVRTYQPFWKRASDVVIGPGRGRQAPHP
jgi:predicted dehydrogenase